MIDTIVDQYKIVERIASGGMGEVYKAIDLELERDVAIKCVRPELSELEEATKRFRAEARTLAKLSHLNIATVYRFFAEGERLYLVMEYIDGKPFGEMITNQGSIPHQQAVNLVKDALQGLGYAHRHKIVHRDIKPGNLMVDQENTVKVLDFGIAHLIGGTRLTRVGSAVGTPAYMSPEQVLGRDIDPRTDIYAIGVVLYEMLSGKLPYTANSDFELMRAHLEEVPRPLSELSKNDVPRALQDTVERALAKDTDERFQTAEEFAVALDAAEGNGAARTAIVPPPTQPQTVPVDRAPPPAPAHSVFDKYRAALVGGGAAVVVILLALLFWQKPGAGERSNAQQASSAAAATAASDVNPEASEAGDNQTVVAAAADQSGVPAATGSTTSAPPTTAATQPPPAQPASATVPAGSGVNAAPTPADQTIATRSQPPSRPPPVAARPQARIAVVKISVHEKQGTGRFSRDAGYNGAFRLSIPKNASRNWEVSEVAEVYRDGELVREQTVINEMRTPGTFRSKQRIQGLKTLDPGEYEVRLLFISNEQVLGSHQWKLLVAG